MPSSLPGPLPNWSKWLLENSPFPVSWRIDLLEFLGASIPDDEWRRCVVRFKDVAGTALPVDWSEIGLDIVNITGGAVDTSWTTTDYTTCETAISTWLGTWGAVGYATWKAAELRWYRRKFNPYTDSRPFMDSGPPVRVTPISVAGTLGGGHALTPQVAITITKKTTWPGHWGRIYLPRLGEGSTDTGGRLNSAVVDALCTGFSNLVTGLNGSDFQVVVPTTQTDKAPARGLLGITSVQVDNLMDVERSRRWSTATYKKVLP